MPWSAREGRPTCRSFESLIPRGVYREVLGGLKRTDGL